MRIVILFIVAQALGVMAEPKPVFADSPPAAATRA